MRRKDREVTNKNEIEEIMLQCKTCHVAMIDGDVPYVVPLNFGYKFTGSGSLELYFHSAFEGRKIDILKKNNKVCFEMANEGEAVHAETPCNSGYYFSSVIGYGEVLFLQDSAEKREALSVLFRHQTGKDAAFNDSQAESVCVFKIISSNFTGKKKSRP